ncbi:hypothetical protein BGZ70_001753 [Mortierella alpina]|uniref:Peptidase A1 domain-containing protein n=1 Tax=Mortierella alpina TaxID=64518 RepID=A0A9P6IVI3_MORAP|nr:hypothetical protein BGZ70_001753 [Mortierella alpina]
MCGRLCSDIVRVGGIPVRLTFGEASSRSVGLGGVAASGILGLAPFAKGVDRKSFLETAVEKGTLSTSAFSMFLNDPAPDGSVSGELHFGWLDETKFESNLTYSAVSDPSAWKVPVKIIPRTNTSLPSLRGEAVFDPTQEWIADPEQFAQEFFFALDGVHITLPSSIKSRSYWCLLCPQREAVMDYALGNSTIGIKFRDTTLHIPLTELIGRNCPFSRYYCEPRF